MKKEEAIKLGVLAIKKILRVLAIYIYICP